MLWVWRATVVSALSTSKALHASMHCCRLIPAISLRAVRSRLPAHPVPPACASHTPPPPSSPIRQFGRGRAGERAAALLQAVQRRADAGQPGAVRAHVPLVSLHCHAMCHVASLTADTCLSDVHCVPPHVHSRCLGLALPCAIELAESIVQQSPLWSGRGPQWIAGCSRPRQPPPPHAPRSPPCAPPCSVQLVSLCRFVGIQPFGTDAFLRSRLRRHLLEIKVGPLLCVVCICSDGGGAGFRFSGGWCLLPAEPSTLAVRSSLPHLLFATPCTTPALLDCPAAGG